MESFYTFDPCQISVIFNGAIICGFADNDFVEISYDVENMFSDHCSIDGQVTRIKNNDKRGTVVLKLNSTSSSNKVLSTMAQVDQKTQTAAGAILIKDQKGETVVTGANCWIAGWPKATIGKEIAVREWRIRVAQLEVFYA